MKRKMKRILTLLVTMVMVLAMVVNVSAAEGGQETPAQSPYTLKVVSQTIHDTRVEYKVYQLFKCSLDENNIPNYITGDHGSLVGSRTVEDFEAMKEGDLWDFVASLQTSSVGTELNCVTGKEINLSAGYYLLVPSNLAGTVDSDKDDYNDKGGTVSAPILVAVPEVVRNQDGTFGVNNKVEVNSKDSEVTHIKKITDVDSTYGADHTVSPTGDTAVSGGGDIIEYTITNTVPMYEIDVDPEKVNYYVTDIYDQNLELVKDGVEVIGYFPGTGLKKTSVTPSAGTNVRTVYSVEKGNYFVEHTQSERKIKIYFNYTDIFSRGPVIIKIKFRLKPAAPVGTPINNKSTLTYTNNYYTGEDSELKDEVNSYTFKFKVFKYNTADNEPLQYATFALYNKNPKEPSESQETIQPIVTAISDANGVVDFNIKLNDGTYYVKETVAPNGYRIDENIYVVNITAKKDGTSGEYTGAADITVNGIPIGNTVKIGEGENVSTIYTSADGVSVFGIGNTRGLTLPGTGGMGAALFIGGGIALVVLAVILFGVYIKKQKKRA